MPGWRNGAVGMGKGKNRFREVRCETRQNTAMHTPGAADTQTGGQTATVNCCYWLG